MATRESALRTQLRLPNSLIARVEAPRKPANKSAIKKIKAGKGTR